MRLIHSNRADGLALAVRGGTRVRPRRHDLVRERGARRKSTRVIYDDEQRSYRAKSCLPKGLRRRPVPASSRLLANVPHCPCRHSSPASGRRSQRGPREFHHALPARGQALIEFILVFPMLILLIVNAVNFGAFFFAWITVASAARSGAQYWVRGSAAVGSPTAPTAAQVTSLVTTDISSLPNRSSLVVRVCQNNNATVTCTGSGSGTPPLDPEPSSYISASVDVTYTYVAPIPLWTFSKLGVSATLPPTTIHRQSVMRMIQ
jgi:Flp pilus assembly protein TadG